MTSPRLPALIAALAVVASAGPALPQSAAPEGFAFSTRNLTYLSNGLLLEGEAEIVQGSNRLRADRIEATGADGGRDLNRVEASGSVFFVTPNETLRGDRAVYTPGNDEVVVTGDVILSQGRNVLTGSRVVYNIRTENARVEGGGSSGRVQGVFYPEGAN